VRPRNGTRDQARNYCRDVNKAGPTESWEEVGEWISGQGYRSDLNDVVTELKKGVPLSEIMMEHPNIYCQYRNGLKDIAAQCIKKNTEEFRQVEIVFLTGPTGCGKTRLAMEQAKYKIQGGQLAWWQDYEQEDVICIDEYSNDIKCSDLLALLDGYQLRLNVKGSHTYANWTKVFITSNLRVEQLHPNAEEVHRDALMRRITTVRSWWDEL